MSRLLSALIRLFSSLSWRSATAILFVAGFIVGSGVIILVRANGGAVAGETIQAPREVFLKSVAELASDVGDLPVVGEVRSRSEATVRTESQGQITRVYRALGDTVAAGTVVAEMENASQRAALLQAQGALDAAEANYAKVTGGARTEQRAILEASFASAQTSAVTALLTGYAAIEGAIRGTADTMFSNPETDKPTFNVTTTDGQARIDLESARGYLNAVISWASTQSAVVSAETDLAAELDAAEARLRETRNFLDTLVRALNAAVTSPSVSDAAIAGYRADASSARSNLTAALSGIAAARVSFVSAQKNLEQGLSGGQSEDVLAAQAAVTQAQGAYAAARANLEKTIVRAPISGTINELTIEVGDFVPAFTQVLTVANNNALEIIAYITDSDRADILPGADVIVEGAYRGSVTRVAPAVDPTTKKIEVRVGLSDDVNLTNGQSVTLSIERATRAVEKPTQIAIPIAALKVGAADIVVFSVDEANRLVAHPVTVGPLLGERVIILAGLSFEDRIVTDARGFREGDEVTVR